MDIQNNIASLYYEIYNVNNESKLKEKIGETIYTFDKTDKNIYIKESSTYEIELLSNEISIIEDLKNYKLNLDSSLISFDEKEYINGKLNFQSNCNIDEIKQKKINNI